MSTADASPEKEPKLDDAQEDGSDKEESEATALFDQPLIQQGKRKRRSVEMFSFSSDTKSRKGSNYLGGNGQKFGDIPIIEHSINKNKADELKILYRLCYETTTNVKKNDIKKNLRQFSGWEFALDSEQYKKKRLLLERMTLPGLKVLCDILDIHKSGTKEDIIERLLEFLSRPLDSGKNPPTPRKRKASANEKGPSRKSRKKSKQDSEDEELIDDKEENEEKQEDDRETEETEPKEQESKENEDEKENTKVEDTKVKDTKVEDTKVEDTTVDDNDDKVEDQQEQKMETDTTENKQANEDPVLPKEEQQPSEVDPPQPIETTSDPPNQEE